MSVQPVWDAGVPCRPSWPYPKTYMWARLGLKFPLKWYTYCIDSKNVCTTCMGRRRPMSSQLPRPKNQYVAKTATEIPFKMIYILHRFEKYSRKKRPYRNAHEYPNSKISKNSKQKCLNSKIPCKTILIRVRIVLFLQRKNPNWNLPIKILLKNSLQDYPNSSTDGLDYTENLFFTNFIRTKNPNSSFDRPFFH